MSGTGIPSPICLIETTLAEINSPFELINSPKSPSHLPNVLSPEEVSQLLNFKPKNAQEKRDLAIIELIYSSGLRVSETINVNLRDFEDNKNFLRILGKGL